MVIWVCEASEVNNLTELVVGPNSLTVYGCYIYFYGGYTNNNNNDDFASSGWDPPVGV